jgi:hypothetical protein
MFEGRDYEQWDSINRATGELIKSLTGKEDYGFIPRKLKVGKRLSQIIMFRTHTCVNRAIGAYEVIFNTLGPNQRAQDLFIFTSGLFPAMQILDTAPKKQVLGIYNKHLLPLGERLRPCLKGLLCSIFLGDDPSNLEVTKMIPPLLASICEAVHPPIFYTAVWECILTNPQIRIPAINFILVKNEHSCFHNIVYTRGSQPGGHERSQIIDNLGIFVSVGGRN